jgi:N-glycosidase YbiA
VIRTGCSRTSHLIPSTSVGWPTSEHYFQAQKFEDESARDTIADTASPSEAAKLGRSTRWSLRADWEQAKDDVMRTEVRSKVAQHRVVYETLLATGDATLVECTTNDHYWADGGDGSGRNMLGKILMEVRADLVRDGDSSRGMLPPPWVAIPGLPRDLTGWRTNVGGDFAARWEELYVALGPEARAPYRRRWPAADDEWRDDWLTKG